MSVVVPFRSGDHSARVSMQLLATKGVVSHVDCCSVVCEPSSESEVDLDVRVTSCFTSIVYTTKHMRKSTHIRSFVLSPSATFSLW